MIQTTQHHCYSLGKRWYQHRNPWHKHRHCSTRFRKWVDAVRCKNCWKTTVLNYNYIKQMGYVIITLQGINISHLGKRKIIFKNAILGGYVSSLDGIYNIIWLNLLYPTFWGDASMANPGSSLPLLPNLRQEFQRTGPESANACRPVLVGLTSMGAMNHVSLQLQA